MKFSEIEFKRLMKSYQKNSQAITMEEETELNILVFIKQSISTSRTYMPAILTPICRGMWNFGLEKKRIVYSAIA